MPHEGLKFLMHVLNTIVLLNIVLPQRKVAQINMILKPGKKPTDLKSYRPISLLPINSKLLETLFLKRLMPAIEEKVFIPKQKFGIRKNHSTIEEIHRIDEQKLKSFENKQYCSAAFIDISEAFDNVWHERLLYKFKSSLTLNYYLFNESYLNSRYYFVKNGSEMSKLHPIKSGVPQGSVLGPILCILSTAELPINHPVLIGTNPVEASKKLQKSLDEIGIWANKWDTKMNETKSVHITFTTRTESCPPVQGCPYSTDPCFFLKNQRKK